jgi:hypothetical protein
MVLVATRISAAAWFSNTRLLLFGIEAGRGRFLCWLVEVYPVAGAEGVDVAEVDGQQLDLTEDQIPRLTDGSRASTGASARRCSRSASAPGSTLRRTARGCRSFAGSVGLLAAGRSRGPRPLDIGTRMCERSTFCVPPWDWPTTSCLNGTAHPAVIIGHRASAPAANTSLPSSRDQWLSVPNSSRHDQRRRVRRCRLCSWVKPIAPCT